MLTKTRGWPPQRRLAQAARCRAQRPWRFSTGPRSQAGKHRVRFNAMKYGKRRYLWRELSRVLAKHRRFIWEIKRMGISLPRYPAEFEEMLRCHPEQREGSHEMFRCAQHDRKGNYSHSIVPGGLEVMS